MGSIRKTLTQHPGWKLGALFSLTVLIVLLSASFLPRVWPNHSAVLPRPFGDPWYLIEKPRWARTLDWRETVQKQQGLIETANPRLLFIGDSLTENWMYEGLDVWEQYYTPRDAVNLGIGGDRTENVLWRLGKSSLERLNPKVTVILIGVNNLTDDSPEETARGVIAVVDLVQERLPETRILLLSLFPASMQRDRDRMLIEATNRELAKRVDRDRIAFLELWDHFLEEDSRLRPSMTTDGLHLSPDGYRVWAEAMEPTLAALMGSPRE